MGGPSATPIQLTERQKATLAYILQRSASAQRLVMRVNVILSASNGTTNQEIGKQLGIERNVAAKWRRRWAAAEDQLSALEAAGIEDKELRGEIEAIFVDAPRPGTPAKFTAAEIVKIVAVACEDPKASGRPLSHWTLRELAEEVVRRQIVTSISSRSVGRFLKVQQNSSPTPAVPG